jgi:hypothetical protein
MALEPVVDAQPIAQALTTSPPAPHPSATPPISQPSKSPPLTLKGSVQQVAPFLAGSAYQLHDDSGSIWIRSSHKDFKVGDRVILTGVPRYHQIKVSNQEIGEVYVEEQKRIYKRP